ncbi:MAG: PilZ domain-containing protein [Campylobacteraceae bacterium]|nr:PilZ domain-containing protein [Campylobacteraceae bacterium]
MQMEEIEKYIKSINFAHLYFSKLKLTKLLNYKDIFNGYENFDLDNGPFLKNKYEIIFIEIDRLNKHNFKILNETIKQNETKNILVFATDYKNSVLSKFLVYSSLNHALPLKNKSDEIQKVLHDFLNIIIDKQNQTQKLDISKKIDSIFSFLVFKENTLKYANANAKKFFGFNELSSIEKNFLKIKGMQELIFSNFDDNIELNISDNQNFIFYLNNFPKTKEKIVTIIQKNEKREDSSSLTIDRFKFTEILKDKMAQNSIELSPIILIFINIENYEKLKNADTNLSMHNLNTQILKMLSGKKEFDEKLIYWNQHFFIIFTKEDNFEATKSRLEDIHEKLIYLEYEKDFLPNITSSALNISALDLNEAITCIENINNSSYDKDDFKTDDFYELNNLNAYLSESDQIKYLLNNYLNHKTPVKLLNIYKGLCINTQSNIIKIQDDSYFVSCENLQIYSMKFDNKTVIQAPSLPKDIHANISYINMEKSYVILNNLSYMNFSANNRQHTRVQPRIRMPISIKYKKLMFQGQVLDISTKAIAIILNHNIKDEYLYKNIKLSFMLPNSSNELGYDLMDIEAQVVNLCELDETKSKLVAMLNLEKPYDTYMLSYMYNRQKELIMELKRAAKL